MIPENVQHIHMIAVCGTGMGSLAGMLKTRGYHITGSDEHIYPPMSTFLESIGISVQEGFDARRLQPAPDLVIIGNAVSRGNPEAEEVLNRKIPYMSLPEALKEFFLRGKYSCVVAGTHGKTTTSSLLAWTLEASGRKPGFFIGGLPENFGRGFQLGGGPHFVLEGDEYDSAFFDKAPKFLHYLPDLVILNNVEFDHADIYRSFEDVVIAFRRLINIIPGNGHLVAGIDDPVVQDLTRYAFSHVHTFGFSSDAEWRAVDVRFGPEGTAFRVEKEGQTVADLSLPLSGDHNVRNALGCFVAAQTLGLSAEEIAAAFRRFRGVRKRLQLRGEVDGVLVFDDFAHHPTEVRETLNGLRQRYPQRRIWAFFEPRTATTKRKIFEDAYARAFEAADHVVIAPLYRPDKVPEGERLSVEQLAERLRTAGLHAVVCPLGEAMLELLGAEVQQGDILLFMSNGDFGGVPDRLMQKWAERRSVPANITKS